MTLFEYYSVKPFTQQGGVNEEYNNFAFLHSGSYAKILGAKQNSQYGNSLTGYVMVSYKKQKIYLKYHAWNGVKSSEVQLSYLNYCRLGLPTGKNDSSEVKISKSCWFQYYLHHWDEGIRCPFILAIVSVLLGLVGIFFSIYLR